jgi:hypothetical protein
LLERKHGRLECALQRHQLEALRADPREARPRFGDVEKGPDNIIRLFIAGGITRT